MGIEALIDRVVTTASKLLRAERASLFLVDPVRGELWSKVAQGVQSREIRVRMGHGLVGWVAEHGETLNIKDAYEDERFKRDTDQRTGYRTRTVLCGPVRNLTGEIIGVIQVINKSEGVFHDLDEQLFKAFAHQAAIGGELQPVSPADRQPRKDDGDAGRGDGADGYAGAAGADPQDRGEGDPDPAVRPQRVFRIGPRDGGTVVDGGAWIVS